MGVWIEIERVGIMKIETRVTPLAGVWIEIRLHLWGNPTFTVTPLAGVWIEMVTFSRFFWIFASHSPCGSVD